MQTMQTMNTAQAQATNNLLTIRKLAKAPEGTAAACILTGKWTTSAQPGAISKKDEDGVTRYYSGDIVLSAPLPSVAVSQYLPAELALTEEQRQAIDNILQQEQARKVRALFSSKTSSFGDMQQVEPARFNLAGTFTPERRSDGLTVDSIKGLLASREWTRNAALYYLKAGVSTNGAAKGEQLLVALLKGGAAAATPETWQKLAERVAAIALMGADAETVAAAATANPEMPSLLFSPDQLSTCMNLTARLNNAATAPSLAGAID